MSCLTVVPHAPNKILVFAAQDYRDFLHVFVALVAKIAVFAAQDSGDLLVMSLIRFAGQNSRGFSNLRF